MDPDTPPPARRTRRLLALLAIGVVSSLTTLGAVAVAGITQNFTDVPPSHTFFDEIELVAGGCIAQGFTDGTYRPSQGVDRGSMAAFLARAAGRIGSTVEVGGPFPSLGSPTPTTQSPWTTVATGGIELPDDGCSRTIKLDAQATVLSNGSVTETCHDDPCNVEFAIFVGETRVSTSVSRMTSPSAADAVALTARHTTDQPFVSYSLRARTFNVKPEQAFAIHRQVLATYFPLDTGFTPP